MKKNQGRTRSTENAICSSKGKQEAERKRVEAQGIADYQKIINTGLTKEQLQYEMIKAYKELSVSANSKVIVMGDKNSQVLINSN